MVTPTESQPDAAVELSKTSPLERTSTLRKKRLKKKQRHQGTLDDENNMPSSDLSRESALGDLLAAGDSR